MEEKYEVTQDGEIIGQVNLKREGLYYQLSCRCRMTDSEIHRLFAGNEKLGVLIPENGELVLDTKVAAKRLKPGCGFSLDEKRGRFIPIRPGEAFRHLDKVRSGRLAFQDGEPGMFLDI
jgi:hypothetical protein